MYNLYIVSTPRHWLIAVYLRLFCYADRGAILLIEPALAKEKIYHQISKEIFGDAVESIRDVYRWRQLHQIKHLFKRFDIRHVATGSVNEPYIQYASYLVSKNSKEGCFLIDDGLFSYQYVHNKKVAYYKKIFRKLIWGTWYRTPSSYRIQSEWINGAYLLHNHLFENNDKKINRLPSDWLECLSKETFIERLLSEYYLDKKDINEVQQVIIFGILKDNLATLPSYERDLHLYLDKQLQQGKIVGVKFHPRDKQRSRMEGVVNIPKKIPFEILLSSLNDDVEIIGDISSVLLEFKMLRPQAKVIAVTNNRKGFEESLDYMKRLGIKVVNSYKDLVDSE
ncbi:polysialyltransferase family glycosyltransferase [Galenea microaerophila]